METQGAKGVFEALRLHLVRDHEQLSLEKGKGRCPGEARGWLVRRRAGGIGAAAPVAQRHGMCQGGRDPSVALDNGD